jgi:2-iminobutanoate/2-iminopropanoate deaminase
LFNLFFIKVTGHIKSNDMI